MNAGNSEYVDVKMAVICFAILFVIFAILLLAITGTFTQHPQEPVRLLEAINACYCLA